MDCPRWCSVSKPGEAGFLTRQYANAMFLAPGPVGSSRFLLVSAETDPRSGVETMGRGRCGDGTLGQARALNLFAARAGLQMGKLPKWSSRLDPNSSKMPVSPSAVLDAQRAHRV